MIQNIKNLWKEIDNKTAFIEMAAKDLNRSPNTLHNHWFARFWQVPEEHQSRVVELLQRTIKKQSKP